MPDLSFPASDGELRGYLATPDGTGPWPSVVVIHEIFGLTDDIRAQADRFAAQGYLALAPDLYDWGATARCLIATVRTMMTGRGRALDDVQAARAFLAGRSECSGRVGVIGFCMGGAIAVLVSPEGFDVAAPNYGEVPKDAADRLRGACPMVASYGGKDRTLRGRAQRLDAALETLGVERDVKEYPEAKHGFLFEHTGKTRLTSPWMVEFDPHAADDAWQRIFTFFGAHLQEEQR
jgi:carboxymethylenebutenolidase